MATGKLHVEVELKSPAKKFWESIMDSANLFPKALPNDYKSFQVIQGDGKAPGSIRLIEYAQGCDELEKESIDEVDEANMKLTYSVLDGDLMKTCKVFKGFISVTPKENGCLSSWSCEYEKTSPEVEDPSFMKDMVVKNFKDLDEYILNQKA